MRTTKAIAPLAVALALAACASKATSPTDDSAEATLPRIEASAFYDTPTVEEALREGDSAVRATLVAVVPEFRVVTDQETPKTSEERIGLEFKIVESQAGPLSAGDVVVIESVGFEVEAKSGERRAEIAMDGHGPSDWLVGTDYFFLVAETEVGLQFRSPELVGRLSETGSIASIVEGNNAPDGKRLTSIDEAKAVVAEALAAIEKGR